MCLFFAGCASITVIDSEGQPVKNHDILLYHPAQGIETHFYAMKVIESSSDSVLPVYLNVYEKQNILEKDLKGLYLVLRVKNIKQQREYQLKKVITYREPYGWETIKVVDAVIYNGKAIDKTWQIALPIHTGSYIASIHLDNNADNMPIVQYEFKYNVK